MPTRADESLCPARAFSSKGLLHWQRPQKPVQLKQCPEDVIPHQRIERRDILLRRKGVNLSRFSPPALFLAASSSFRNSARVFEILGLQKGYLSVYIRFIILSCSLFCKVQICFCAKQHETRGHLLGIKVKSTFRLHNNNCNNCAVRLQQILLFDR